MTTVTVCCSDEEKDVQLKDAIKNDKKLPLKPIDKNKLRENTEFAIGKGSFGVPTFYLEDEMFWGIDSMKFLIEDIEK